MINTKQVAAFIKLVERQKVVEVVLPIQRGLARTDAGAYQIVDTEKDKANVLRGIWLHIQNYPGKNRGFQIYFYFQFPHFVTVDPEVEKLSDRLLLKGKYLHYQLSKDEATNPDIIKEHLAKFEKIILTAMYLYTKEKEEEENGGNN